MATSSLYYVAFDCEQSSKADICSVLSPILVIVARVVLLALQLHTDTVLLGHKQNVLDAPVYPGPAISHCVSEQPRCSETMS